jgi:hypothetical protein
MTKTKRKSKAASSSKVRPRAGAEQKSITSKLRAESKWEKVLDLLRRTRLVLTPRPSGSANCGRNRCSRISAYP